MPVRLDKKDAAILQILQQNSTVATKDIAAQVGLSVTPTYERIRYLEQEGVILKYVAIVDREKIDLNLLVYCNVTLKEQSKTVLENFENAVSQMPEVLEVISISGHYDYMLKIVARDIRDYNDFVVNKLANLPYIGTYHSSIVLNEVKRDTALPLE